MSEPTSEVSYNTEEIIASNLQTEETPIQERKVPKASTLLAAAAYLLGKEANKIYPRDPDLEQALRKEDIKGCRYTMLFGAHSITDGLYNQLRSADVITGELSYVVSEDEGSDKAGMRIDLRTGAEVFWDYLSSVQISGVEAISKETVEGRRNMAALYQEGKAFLVAEGTKISRNPYGFIASKASGEYWKVKTGFLSLMALSAIAYDAREAKITRREFLQLALAGAGYLAFSKLYDALHFTAINQQYIAAPPSRERSLAYSKVEEAGDSLGEAYLALTKDPLIAREFKRLVEIRNQVMALNALYLAHLINGHAELKQILSAGEKEVDIFFFAGGGHTAAKAEFCKGSRKLQEMHNSTVTDIIDQYIMDMEVEVDEQGKLITYYSGYLTTFASPYLYRKGGVSFTAQEKIKMPDSPSGIMYRNLIERIKSEKSPSSTEALRSLLSQIVKDEMVPYQSRDFITVGEGIRKNSYKPVDTQTLQRRMMNSGVIPSNVNYDNSDIEVHRNVTNIFYPYGDNREVGIVIVNGIPFPFLSKEDLSFLEA